jgi:hypothetical protein
MASTKAKIALAAALAATIVTPLVLQRQHTSQLANELATLRQSAPELNQLRAEVERLSAEAHAVASERDTERAELVRLRGRLASLTPQDGKATETIKTPTSPRVASPSATRQPEEDRVARTDWRNIGFQMPTSTVQTLEWAKINGDTNVVARGLAWADDESRNQIDAIFAAAPEEVKARYGTADAYILSLFDHSSPADDRHTLVSYRVLDENISAEGARLTLEYSYGDGSTHTLQRRYARIGDEWCQALDFDAPSQAKLNVGLQAGESTLPDPASQK